METALTIADTTSRDEAGCATEARRAQPAHGGVLHVCSLADMPNLVADVGARYLVSAINNSMLPPTPPGLAGDRHLQLGMNDISQPREGLVLPGEAHVAALLAFVRRWDHDGPLVVHCWAGISRSTASAFITLCALNPSVDEAVIAGRLRTASRTATPNPRLVAIADSLLSRDGRMVRAISQIGRGEDAMAGRPFWLPSRQES